MNTTVLLGLFCAGTLVILAIILLIYVLHRVSQPVQRSQGVQPPAPSRPSVLTRVASTRHSRSSRRAYRRPGRLPTSPTPASHTCSPLSRVISSARSSRLLPLAITCSPRSDSPTSSKCSAGPAATSPIGGVSRPSVSTSCFASRTPSPPRLVIELDDRSHYRADRRDRDAFVDDVLASAGIPILHVRLQRSYDTQALAQQIAVTLGTAMPSVAAPAPPVTVALTVAPGSHVAPSAPDSSPAQPTHMRYVCSQCKPSCVRPQSSARTVVPSLYNLVAAPLVAAQQSHPTPSDATRCAMV